jgi:hypothetical protein
MFTAHEIFARMPAPSAEQLFAYLHEKEKRLYKATIETLAKQRKLRGVFIERKPRPERHAWMRDALGKKVNDGVAAQLLQIWLVSAHSGMLCDFLDHLGIPHDENGTISEIPTAPSREKLEEAATALLAKHDPAVVTVYLHAFQALDDDGGWPTLDALLAEDPRLKLG